MISNFPLMNKKTCCFISGISGRSIRPVVLFLVEALKERLFFINKLKKILADVSVAMITGTRWAVGCF